MKTNHGIQRKQGLVKRYISCFALCVIILMIGVFVSIPIKVEVISVGEKPPFLFALFLAIGSLAISIVAAISSYLYWFQGEQARKNLTSSLKHSPNRFFIFHILTFDPTFLFWYIRIFMPICTLFLFGIFLLVVFSAF